MIERASVAALAVGAVVATVFATACGGGTTGASTSAASTAVRLRVVASFYPLQFIVDRIGAERVHVSNLTPAGAEPHDLELTADDTVRLQDADLVVYLSGFSSAVDDAVDS